MAAQFLPALWCKGEPVRWIIDDTGFPKKGKHSVGVARQHCGQTGKRHNCRVAVSLSIATTRGSLPVGYRLYLPRGWTDEDARRQKAGVPDEVVFETTPVLAMRQIETALVSGYLRGVVLADAAYGDETGWREQLAGHGLTYAVGIRPATTVWWGDHQPLSEPAPTGRRGRPRTRVQHDATHRPITVIALARHLPARVSPNHWPRALPGSGCVRPTEIIHAMKNG